MSIWRRVYDDRRSVALPLLVALLINAGVWLLGVLPLQTRLSAAEADSREAAVELVNARRIGEQASEASASRGQADTQLKAFYDTILPGDFATAVKTTNIWLQQAARDVGLTFRQSQFDREPVDDSRLTRAYSTVSLTGGYADLRRFLHALETAEEFIVLERVELIEADSNQEGGGPISIDIVVSTYFVASASR
jgi:Tfp pilus assembly protein PilO